MLYIIVFHPQLHVVYGLYTLCVIPSAVGRDYKYVCVCVCVFLCLLAHNMINLYDKWTIELRKFNPGFLGLSTLRIYNKLEWKKFEDGREHLINQIAILFDLACHYQIPKTVKINIHFYVVAANYSIKCLWI